MSSSLLFLRQSQIWFGIGAGPPHYQPDEKACSKERACIVQKYREAKDGVVYFSKSLTQICFDLSAQLKKQRIFLKFHKYFQTSGSSCLKVIKRHPQDKDQDKLISSGYVLGNQLVYPLDRDLSSGSRLPPFKHLEPVFYSISQYRRISAFYV